MRDDGLGREVKVYIVGKRDWRWLWLRRERRPVFAGLLESVHTDFEFDGKVSRAMIVDRRQL